MLDTFSKQSDIPVSYINTARENCWPAVTASGLLDKHIFMVRSFCMYDISVLPQLCPQDVVQTNIST